MCNERVHESRERREARGKESAHEARECVRRESADSQEGPSAREVSKLRRGFVQFCVSFEKFVAFLGFCDCFVCLVN